MGDFTIEVAGVKLSDKGDMIEVKLGLPVSGKWEIETTSDGVNIEEVKE